MSWFRQIFSLGSDFFRCFSKKKKKNIFRKKNFHMWDRHIFLCLNRLNILSFFLEFQMWHWLIFLKKKNKKRFFRKLKTIRSMKNELTKQFMWNFFFLFSFNQIHRGKKNSLQKKSLFLLGKIFFQNLSPEFFLFGKKKISSLG